MSEQFENIIRNKLQEAEPSFDPAAWEQMKKKLDDADRRRPFFWWWIGGLLLIVAGLGSWWWFGNIPADKPATDITVNNSTGSPEKNNPPSANPGEIPDDVNNPAGNTPADKSVAQNNTNNVDNGKGYTKANNPATVILSNVNNSPAGNNSSAPSPDPVNAKDPAAENTPANVNNPAATNTPASVNNQPAGNPLPATIPAVPANVDNPAQKETPADSSATEQDQKEKQTKKQKRGFDGGLFLGPDFNVTPSFRGMPIGVTGGLIVRYHVNNRWYISSGVGYAKKLYGASPKEYSSYYPPAYYAIDADCDVIDIPLNISYTFAQGKKSTWSAMAGASSYLMLKEKYEYYYPNDVKYKREYKNQNQHYFSVINLGVTWEKQTRSRLSWGLQPYVKIPVNGVGQGSVKVYSAGVTVQAILGKKKD